MEIEEEGEGDVYSEEGGEGTLRALVGLKFLAQEAEPSRTTLVDTRNGFNDLSRMEMMWTVQNRCPAGARFTFN